MQKIIKCLLICLLLISCFLFSNKIYVEGTVTDALTGSPIGESYKVLLEKSFGCPELGKNCPLISTLERATPIILTGLSATVAIRSGMFSIGQEGQFLMGAAMAAWLGYTIHLPFGIHQLVIMLASMAAGAAYGFIPGILKVKLKVNELLSTIMMNLIAIHSATCCESGALVGGIGNSSWWNRLVGRCGGAGRHCRTGRGGTDCEYGTWCQSGAERQK